MRSAAAIVAHRDLIKLVQACGYDVTVAGVCVGYTGMTLQALLSDDLLTYQLRLKFIEELIKTEEYLSLPRERKLPLPNDWEGMIKMLEKDGSYLAYKNRLEHTTGKTIDAKSIASDMLAFCEGIAVSQTPYTSLYRPWFEPHQAPTAQSPTTTPLVHSKLLEEKGGAVSLGSTIGVYNITDLEAFIQRLAAFIQDHNVTCPIGFVIQSSNHRILLGFDVSEMKWFVADSNSIFMTDTYEKGNFSEHFSRRIASAFLINPVKETTVLHIEAVITSAGQADNKKFSEASLDFFKEEISRLLASELFDKKDDTTGAAPLYIAADMGHIDIAKLLLEKGADLNAKKKSGHTPLYVAAKEGRIDVVKFLLEKGAEINAKLITSETPLLIAALRGHIDIAKLLLEKGAEINAELTTGETPLFIAAVKGHIGIIKLLLEKGADFNTTIKSGHTPLYVAAQCGHIDIVKFLDEKGADLNAKLITGATPLYIAAQWGHIDIVKFLLEKGADPNAVITTNGATPLFIAAQNGHTDIVALLLEHSCLVAPFISTKNILIEFAKDCGAEVRMASFLNTQNDYPVEVTPLDIAKIMGHDNTVTLLLGSKAVAEAEHRAEERRKAASTSSTLFTARPSSPAPTDSPSPPGKNSGGK